MLETQRCLSILIIKEYANRLGCHHVTTNQDGGGATAESSQLACSRDLKGTERKGEQIGS